MPQLAFQVTFEEAKSLRLEFLVNTILPRLNGISQQGNPRDKEHSYATHVLVRCQEVPGLREVIDREYEVTYVNPTTNQPKVEKFSSNEAYGLARNVR